MTLQTASGILKPRPPFDLRPALKFLGDFKPASGEQTLAEHSLTKAVFVNSQLIVFNVRSTGTVSQPELAYTLYSEAAIDAEIRAAGEERLAFFLSLDDDLQPFYDLARDDAVFAPILRQLYGYHQVKFLTPFENACWAVLTQRNPMAVAGKMKRALTEAFGAALSLEGESYAAFPEPGQMSVDITELNAVVGNKQKADYLSAVITAFRHVNEGWLRDAPYQEVEMWLRGIRGIGAWSASFILLRGLGRMEYAPISEARIKDAIRRHYGPVSPPDVARRYGDWQGYWAHYLRVAG